MSTLNLLSAFKFPSQDAKSPPPPSSPERVHGTTRPMSAISSKTSRTNTTTTADNDSQQSMERPSPQSSPSRKVNLFADYHHHARAATTTEAGFALSGSPSLPEIHALRHHTRTNSDVQGLVKRFEHLEVRDRDAELAERRKKHEAELSRAQIAREEAEADVKRLREELRRLKKDGEEGRQREVQVAKRLEVVMDEYAQAKQSSASHIAAYEKELRKARKETFKSSSAVVKLQQEVKSTRNSLRVVQADLDMEKRKVEQRDQKTFEAEYQLVAVQEELDKLKSDLQIVLEEKEALKTRLREEEVAIVAAEGFIALPQGNRGDEDLLNSPTKLSPQKRPVSPLSDDKENAGEVVKKVGETRMLQRELARERLQRRHHDELAEFLRLECQFRCCVCRTGPNGIHNTALSLSDEFAIAVANIRNEMHEILTPPASVHEEQNPEAYPFPEQSLQRSPRGEEPMEIVTEPGHEIDMEVEPAVAAFPDADQSVTMTGEKPDIQSAQEHMVDEEVLQAPRATPVDFEIEDESITYTERSTAKVPLLPSSPGSLVHSYQTTPFRPQPTVRTITTTTTIPMQFSPAKPAAYNFENAENIPPEEEIMEVTTKEAPTFDREAALAAIAYRRGRAKSIADGHATPRKQMMEGVGVQQRRDISAPALGQKKSEPNLAKGTASVGRATGRRMG